MAAKPPARLTPRQVQVALLLAEGCTSTAIAGRLCIRPLTARQHIRDVQARTGLRGYGWRLRLREAVAEVRRAA